ncbi:TPA: hypothetical protein ACRR2I_004364, partial [Providencia rettgeri]
PTCDINSGNEDIIFDYGKISPGLLKPNEATAVRLPGDSTRNLLVSCDALTFLTFTTTESYPLKDYSFYPNFYLWPNATKWIYGIVDAQTGKDIGVTSGVSISASTATVDGKKAFVSFVSTGVDSDTLLVKNRVGGMTKTNQGGSTISKASELNLMPGKLFSLDISSPSIYIKSLNGLAADGVDIGEGIDFIGQIVMTFSFGV